MVEETTEGRDFEVDLTMFDEPNPENAEAAWDDETRELGGSYESFRRCGDTRSSQRHAMPS